MWWPIAKHVLKLASIIAPYAIPKLLSLLGLTWIDALKSDASKSLASAVVLGLVCASDVIDLKIPRERALEFREDYLEELVKKSFGPKVGDHVRFNVMFARRRWFLLWLIRVFEWSVLAARHREHPFRGIVITRFAAS